MNAWLGLALGVIGLLAGVGAMLRWTSTWLLRTFADHLDATLEEKLDAKLEEKLGRHLAPIHHRLDGLDAKVDRLEGRVDHIAEVVDLRLRPLEADMALVKQHLLGTPAA